MATVDDLRAFAKANQIDLPGSANKAEILATLGFESEDKADAVLAQQDNGSDAPVTDDHEADEADEPAAEAVDTERNVVRVATESGLNRTRASKVTYRTKKNGTISARVKAAR